MAGRAREAPVRVAGIDGVGPRWLAVALEVGPDATAPGSAIVVGSLVAGAEQVLDWTAGCATVGIDVPVGLVPQGRRAAEAEARALLGRDGRSIFPTAPAAAYAALATGSGLTGAAGRIAAQEASLAAGGTGVSTQSWAIAPKIVEVEAAVRSLARQHAAAVVEVHPETSFRVMADVAGADVAGADAATTGLALEDLAHEDLAPADGRSVSAGPPTAGWFRKRSPQGAAQRARLLDLAFVAPRGWAAAVAVELGRHGASLDDALDALAAAWTALRHSTGRSRLLGGADRDRAVWSDGTPAPGRSVIVV